MYARLLEHTIRRWPAPCCLARDSPSAVSEPVRSSAEALPGPLPSRYDDIAIQAYYQSGQLPAATAVSVLLDPPSTLAAAEAVSGNITHRPAAAYPLHGTTQQQREQSQARQQLAQQPEHSQLQQLHQNQHTPQQQQQQQTFGLESAAVPPQLLYRQSPSWQHVLQRPVYVRGQTEQLAQLLRSCTSIQQLQAVLQPHMQQTPPSCLAVAMQQLAALRRADSHQQLGLGRASAAQSAAGSEELAQQLSRALLQQLHAASPQALTAFLAAAASARPLALPPDVLEQLASELVHRALHAACQQQHHQQHQQQQHSSSGQAAQCSSSSSSSSALGQLPPAAPPVQQLHMTAKAAWAFAQLQLRQPALWAELASVAGESLEQLGAQDCVLLCWSMARARHKDPRLFHALLLRVSGCARQLSPDSVSCLLWSCARVGHYHHASVSALVLAAAGSMERCSPHSLGRCLWACVALRHYEPRLLRAARVRALARMQLFEPHSLVLVMWSLAKFGVLDEQLAAAVAGQALQCLAGFTVQGLANMAWAVAKLQQQGGPQQQWGRTSGSRQGKKQQWQQQQQQQQQEHDSTGQQVQQRLLVEICAAAAPRLGTARLQELCNLLWACAVTQLPHQRFLEAAGARLVAVAEDATPHDLAQALWALEVLRHRRKAVQQVLVLQSLNKLNLFGPQALSNWAWAVASAGMQLPRGLPAAVAQQFQVLLPEFTAQGTATTLWALSKMGRSALTPQLMHAASSHILANLACYNTQDLCNVVMACCKAGYREPTLLQGLAGAAAAAAAATLSSSSSIVEDCCVGLRPPAAAATTAAGAAGAAASVHARAPLQLSSPVAAAARSAAQRKQLTAQGVCNLVWAFAGLGWHDQLLLQRLEQLAGQLVARGQLQPERIAGLLQGFALLGESCEALLSALASAGPKAAGDCKQQLQRGSAAHPLQGDKQAGQHLTPQQSGQQGLLLPCWPADSLALLVWAAAASAGHRVHGNVVLAALRQLQAVGVSGLSQQRRAQLHEALVLLATDWGVIAWGEDQGLGQSTSSTSSSSSSSSSRQTMDAPASRGSPLAEAAADSTQPGAAAGAARGVVSPPAGAAGVLSGRLVRQCAAAWQQQQADSVLSQVEEEVLQALQSMGLQPLMRRWLQPQYSSTTGWLGRELNGWSNHTLCVNVGVAGSSLGPGGRPVAVCVLPPAAVSSSWPSRVLGRTALGQRCLQAAGWQVVCITWEEWEGLAQQRGAQRQLLQRVLGLSTS